MGSVLVAVGLSVIMITVILQKPDKEMRILSFSADSVNGTVYLVGKGKKFHIESQAGSNIEKWNVQVGSAIPANGNYYIAIRNPGLNHATVVAQEPAKKNNFELRILISSGSEAVPASFELFAVPIPKHKKRYNVVIITVDTLRADHLGCNGYTRDTSPNIDAFTRQAVNFKNAFSTGNSTPPAHASLFTSKYVGDHGLLYWGKLAEKEQTLAEELKRYGYITAASVNLSLLTEQNLGQGIDFQKEGLCDGKDIIDDFFRFLNTYGTSPFFLWLHFYDVHRPYGRHPEWTHRFNSKGRSGVGDIQAHYNLRPLQDPDYGFSLQESGLNDVDLRFIADRYDAGIAYVDALLGPLFEKLSSPQFLDDTIVVVTSDHGENLLDDPGCLFSHDPYLSSVATHVPLLVRLPGAAHGGKTVEEIVSLIDIGPTVMETIGVEIPTSFASGKSLLKMLEGNSSDIRTREIHLECWGWETLKAVRSDDWLIIHDFVENDTNFFAIATDPSEKQPLKRPMNGEADRLHDKLVQFSERLDLKLEPPKLEPKKLEKLRSLGYVQ